jgi:RNA polymerase sigma factor (sigma-70 family)
VASDSELLEAWAAGDQKAGSDLFDRHFDGLYRFFRNKAPSAVEDLMQDTMLACVRSRDTFRGASSFRTYLFTIARHALYAHYKQSQRHAASEEGDIGSLSVADLGTSPSGIVARRREHELLLRSLRAIPLDLQLALELHFWEELSGPEMAEVLGVPEGTVRSRIRRGKEALAAKMEELSTAGDEEILAKSLEDLDAWARAVRESVEGAASED